MPMDPVPPSTATQAVVFTVEQKEKLDKIERQVAALEGHNAIAADMVAALREDSAKMHASWADADIVRALLPGLAQQGLHGLAALAKARETVAAYRFFFKG